MFLCKSARKYCKSRVHCQNKPPEPGLRPGGIIEEITVLEA